MEAQDGIHRLVALVTVYTRALGVALAQKTDESHKSSERAAPKGLLRTLELKHTLIKADALHTTEAFFAGASPRGPADVLLTVKGNEKTLHRLIQCQFQGKSHIFNQVEAPNLIG